MKKSILFLILTLNYTTIVAQVLNQDADGKSTIVWSGSTFGIDVTEALVKINYYKFSYKPKEVVWGIDLQAKNSEGIAGVFSDSEFTPNASLSGTIGYKTSKVIYKNIRINKYIADKQSINNQLQSKGPRVETQIKTLIDTKIVGCGTGSQATNNLKTKLKNIASYQGLTKKIMASLSEEDAKLCPVLEHQILLLLEAVEQDILINEYINLEKTRDELSKKMNEEFPDPVAYTSDLIIYTRGGAKAMEFTYDLSNSFNIVDTRFIDTLHVGSFLELGITYRINNLFFGAAIGINRANNFSALEKAEYKFTFTDTTITGGSLQSSKSITAYSGEYNIFTRYNLMADVLYLIDMNQNDSYILIGPYYRNNSIGSSSSSENTTLGFGSYFINGKAGKFLGGVYVQTNDLSGESDLSFKKTLSAGLIGKLALSAVLPK